MSFAEKLKVGFFGEDAISRWLIRSGNQVLPAYQVEVSHGKGPRLFGGYGQLVSPDLMVIKDGGVRWIEAKTKTAFTWHRKTKSWQTGIDLRHWGEYIKVSFETGFDVWILFLHKRGASAKDTPEGMESPAGLFGNEIRELQSSIDHVGHEHGPSGMVYWRLESLRLLAGIDSIENHVQQTVHQDS